MKQRIYWGLATLVILLCAVGMFLWLRHDRAELKQREKALEAAQKELENRQKPKTVPPVQRPTQKEHVHEDGTAHEDEHPPAPKPVPEPKLSPIQIPEGIEDPDVLAAWQRLEDISKNIWEWGGQPSERAAELIHQLMPPPDGFSGPTAHDDVEDTINLLGELAWSGDPRAVETVATYSYEGIVMGRDLIEALVDIGPPSVPFLISQLDPPYDGSLMSAVMALGQIAEQYRKDLGGVVEHIIIPKFEVIAEVNILEHTNMVYPRMDAREALSRLKQNKGVKK